MLFESIKRFIPSVWDGEFEKVKMIEHENGAYVLHDDLEKLEQNRAKTYQRYCDVFAEGVELHKRILELESQVKGPKSFETWQDAAMDERLKRITAEDRIKELEAELSKTTLQPDKGGSLVVRSNGVTHRIPFSDLAAIPQLIQSVNDLEARLKELELSGSAIGRI